jgi:hypothetical protein
MICERIKKSELINKVNIEGLILLCCSSFEERYIVIPSLFAKRGLKDIIIFKNGKLHSNIEKNALIINGCYDNNASIISTKIDEPLLTTSKIKAVISSLVENNNKKLIIDITTFTHEMLLVLLMGIYKNRTHFDNIQYLYLGAKDYSINEKTEEKWLSKGCKKIRSVFGYPGKLIPGNSICLTVLVGYEHERAAIMIEEIDPDFLLLGKGLPSDKSLTNLLHKAPMLHFQNTLDNFLSRRDGTNYFDFSCSELELTYKKIKEEINKYSNANHIIVPLNTKISSLAAGILALENPNIQVCYSEPEIYNFDGYSKSDDNVTVMNNIFETP